MVAAITIAIALRRSSGENSVGTMPSTIGRIAAPPSPSTARAAMNAPADGAYAAASELTPKITSATLSVFLRPNRSPIMPPGIIAAAKTSVYAATNHWSWEVEACSPLARAGNARLRIVTSKPTASTAITSAPTAHHLRAPSTDMRPHLLFSVGY